MHRKFIALIVTTAILITGFSAAPARAGDAEKLLGGLAALALVGVAVHQYEKKKDRRREQQHVTRQDHNPHRYQPNRNGDRYRPLPPRVARYDLPGKCLTPAKGYAGDYPLLKPLCLKKHYRHTENLPQTCKISYWNGERRKQAFEPRCLRQHGYRVVHNY